MASQKSYIYKNISLKNMKALLAVGNTVWLVNSRTSCCDFSQNEALICSWCIYRKAITKAGDCNEQLWAQGERETESGESLDNEVLFDLVSDETRQCYHNTAPRYSFYVFIYITMNIITRLVITVLAGFWTSKPLFKLSAGNGNLYYTYIVCYPDV